LDFTKISAQKGRKLILKNQEKDHSKEIVAQNKSKQKQSLNINKPNKKF
jgi:hypothetical protein